MVDFNIIPRRGRYMIRETSDEGKRRIIEQHRNERDAVERLQELKEGVGRFYLEQAQVEP